MHSGSMGDRDGSKDGGCMIMLCFFCFPFLTCLAGVNSFMVYMAYKDLYQVSNTEVTTHLLCGLGIWMGFLLLLMTLALYHEPLWSL